MKRSVNNYTQVFCTIFLIAVISFTMSCATPKGSSTAEKRDYVQKMRADTLAELYEKAPESRSKIDRAVGYGVFSNRGGALLIGGSGHGYGVILDKDTEQDTYMRMAYASAGLGVGLKDSRMVIIFYDRDKMRRFIDKGWEFSLEGDASVKAGDKGGSVTSVDAFNQDMEIYHFTKTGLALRASVGGSKFWKDRSLN